MAKGGEVIELGEITEEATNKHQSPFHQIAIRANERTLHVSFQCCYFDSFTK